MHMFLGFVSLLLAVAGVSVMVHYRDRILHPAFWTNAGFVGYAVGGIYFSAAGTDGAMFLNLSGIDVDRQMWLSAAAGLALLGWGACNLGFFVGDRTIVRTVRDKPINFVQELSPHTAQLSKLAALLLIAAGLAYYVYFAQQVAGGVLPLFRQVGAYRYLVADAGMSSLPFHLVYGGALLWMLAWLNSGNSRWVGLAFIPLGMFIILSTGRITFANAYAFSAILAFIFVCRQKADWRAFTAGLAMLLPLNVVYYFWRQYTSFAYSGRAEEFALLAPKPEQPEAPIDAHAADAHVNLLDQLVGLSGPYAEKIGYIFRALIGGGNVPDLQQIVLIIKGLQDGSLSLTYGATYFDWINNLFASISGAPQSVGHRILAVYFPEKVGVPVPGMIGEAILNFWFLAPFALALFAIGMTLLYSKVVHSGSAFKVLIYCIFLIGFWALFLKVDSSLLRGFLWAAGPVSAAWLAVICFDRLYRGVASA